MERLKKADEMKMQEELARQVTEGTEQGTNP